MLRSLRDYKKSLDARRSTREAFEQLYNMECWEPAELPRSIIYIIEEATGEKKEVIGYNANIIQAPKL